MWAGVGWSQDRETGRGLFVEHEGVREQDVREQITASLRDLQAIRGLDLGPIHTSVVGAMCTGAPTCALVICGYTHRALARDHRRPSSAGAGVHVIRGELMSTSVAEQQPARMS